MESRNEYRQSGSSCYFKRFDRLSVIVVSLSESKKLILN